MAGMSTNFAFCVTVDADPQEVAETVYPIGLTRYRGFGGGRGFGSDMRVGRPLCAGCNNAYRTYKHFDHAEIKHRAHLLLQGAKFPIIDYHSNLKQGIVGSAHPDSDILVVSIAIPYKY